MLNDWCSRCSLLVLSLTLCSDLPLGLETHSVPPDAKTATAGCEPAPAAAAAAAQETEEMTTADGAALMAKCRRAEQKWEEDEARRGRSLMQACRDLEERQRIKGMLVNSIGPHLPQ